MKTTRELLELAAKVMGYLIEEVTEKGAWIYPKDSVRNAEGDLPVFHWKPQYDDGDSVRLEAALGLCVNWYGACVLVGPSVCGVDTGHAFAEYFNNHNGDKQAARRLATLRAAAMIGEKME